MKTFSELLTEDKGGKNLHLEHIEDEILNYGIDGGRASINFIQSLRDMLSGESRSSINMTVKWDGAPAIFAGIDPEDGRFFVAKKSVFNVDPKLYKTSKEIDADLSGDLNEKFKVALTEFSKLGIKEVLQGDLMYTSKDLSTETIDGVSYYTFQPNTIVYAVAVDSSLGKIMNSASATLNFAFKSPDKSASISASVLYNLGLTLNTDFFATKNLPSLGSVPANIAGAPSHLTVMLTEDLDSPASISLSERTKLIAALPPGTPKFSISSSICSKCRFLPSFPSSKLNIVYNLKITSIKI